MKKMNKIIFIISLILGSIILLSFFSGNISFSPSTDKLLIGCMDLNSNEENENDQSGGTGNGTKYGNCVADSLAKLNAIKYSSVDEGQLRLDITTCLQALGYQIPVGKNPGVPLSKMSDALKCKKEVMQSSYGIDEDFGTDLGGGMSPPRTSSTDSVFENNCPDKGSTILFQFSGLQPPSTQRFGHSVVCIVNSCHIAGRASLTCTESSYGTGGGVSYNVDVAIDGSMTTTPPYSATNLQNVAWTQIQ